MARTDRHPLGEPLATPAELNGTGMRLLRTIAATWLCYMLALALGDRFIVASGAATRALPAAYYAAQSLIALSVLALSLSARAAARLGRWFLPLIIAIMSALPLIVTTLTVPSSLPGPFTGAVGLVDLRTLPILLTAAVLVAWQYSRRIVLLFNLGMVAFIILLHLREPSHLLSIIGRTLIQGVGLLILSYCVSVVTHKLRSQQASLEQANIQLRHYTSTLEQLLISRERTRLARELHDTLAHTLSGLTLQLETTKAYWELDHQAVGPMVEAALETARTGLQETRRALKALRASPLEELGLRSALSGLAKRASIEANLRLECAIAEDLPVLAPDVEQCIYRIAQEAIANVVQHANADELQVQLLHEQGRILLSIRDNGRGFDSQRAGGDLHFGLAGMDERAALAGGKLAIVSAPGEGMTVSLTL
jgi:signal transduction histidine kinase